MDGLIDLLGAGRRDAPAIGAPSRSALCHGELQAQMQAVGTQLRGAGVGAEDRVAIVLDNGPAMAAAFVCMAPWCATAPLNPAYKPDEFDFYLGDLDARALVVEENATSPAIDVAAARGVSVLRVRSDAAAAAGAIDFADVPQSPAKPRPASALALVLHTSGTTSRPKMVPLSQGNLVASARNIVATLRLAPEDRCLNIMPLFHIHGLVAGVLASLHAGARVACAPGFNALRFFGWLDDLAPTWFTAVPTMHQAILARAGRNAGIVARRRLRFLRSSSAPLPAPVMTALEAAFDAPVVESYGMTEAAHQMSSNPLPPGVRRPGSVGLAAGPEIAVLDAAGRALAPGAVGEVAIRGDNVTRGYENNPRANAAAFSNGWFRTGDQGVIDAAGHLTLTGRLKEIINRGGEKIAPREVDDALAAHPAVAQAVAFALPHPKLGEEVAAVVVLHEGAEVGERALRAFAGEALADFKVPRRILIRDAIPKGATGKLQRIGLARKLGLAE